MQTPQEARSALRSKQAHDLLAEAQTLRGQIVEALDKDLQDLAEELTHRLNGVIYQYDRIVGHPTLSKEK